MINMKVDIYGALRKALTAKTMDRAREPFEIVHASSLGWCEYKVAYLKSRIRSFIEEPEEYYCPTTTMLDDTAYHAWLKTWFDDAFFDKTEEVVIEYDYAIEGIISDTLVKGKIDAVAFYIDEDAPDDLETAIIFEFKFIASACALSERPDALNAYRYQLMAYAELLRREFFVREAYIISMQVPRHVGDVVFPGAMEITKVDVSGPARVNAASDLQARVLAHKHAIEQINQPEFQGKPQLRWECRYCQFKKPCRW